MTEAAQVPCVCARTNGRTCPSADAANGAGRQQRSRPTQRGFTLIEVLVSMVVVAVGILAVLGVQSRTLTDTQTAVRRAQAIRLIDDLSERMQANPSALKNIEDYESPFSDEYDPDTPTTPDCDTGSCIDTDLTQYDLIEWKKAVVKTLPGGKAELFTVAGEGPAIGGYRQLGVMVAWRENEREIVNPDGSINNADTQEFKEPLQMKNLSDGSAIKDSENDDVSCPADHICHLQYVQLTSRCTTDELAGSVVLCADGLHRLH